MKNLKLFNDELREYQNDHSCSSFSMESSSLEKRSILISEAYEIFWLDGCGVSFLCKLLNSY